MSPIKKLNEAIAMAKQAQRDIKKIEKILPAKSQEFLAGRFSLLEDELILLSADLQAALTKERLKILAESEDTVIYRRKK